MAAVARSMARFEGDAVCEKGVVLLVNYVHNKSKASPAQRHCLRVNERKA